MIADRSIQDVAAHERFLSGHSIFALEVEFIDLQTSKHVFDPLIKNKPTTSSASKLWQTFDREGACQKTINVC